MLAALSGFAIIWTVVAVGWLLAHTGTVGDSGQAFLNKMAFMAASPALLFTIVAGGSLDHLFSTTLLASVAAIAVSAGLYLIANRLFFRHSLGGTTIGWMAASYTNAGNLGLPIALHLLGDMTWMAPILLLQVAILQPFGLASLDAAAAHAKGVRLSVASHLTLPFRNPITVGILAGLVVNLTRVTLPEWLSSAISKTVIDGYLGRSGNDDSLSLLTERQGQVLKMIAEGQSTKQIGSNLNLSVKTVETYRSQIMEKLDIHDIAGLVRYAIRHGIVPL